VVSLQWDDLLPNETETLLAFFEERGDHTPFLDALSDTVTLGSVEVRGVGRQPRQARLPQRHGDVQAGFQPERLRTNRWQAQTQSVRIRQQSLRLAPLHALRQPIEEAHRSTAAHCAQPTAR
jgi:hypothetical protein